MGSPRLASARATGPNRSAAAGSNGSTATDSTNVSMTPWSLRDALAPAPNRSSAKVIELVLKHVPLQLDALDAAIQSGDATATRAQAHKLKGSTASIGARRMAAVSEALQRASEMGDLSGAPTAMRALRTSFAGVHVALERELRTSTKPGSGAPAAH